MSVVHETTGEMTMKPFNLEKALKHPELVRTRDGQKIKGIMDTGFGVKHSIVVCLDVCLDFCEVRKIVCYTKDGVSDINRKSAYDLFMIEEKTTFYVNIYRKPNGDFIHCAHESEELARYGDRQAIGRSAYLSRVAVAVPFTYEVE